MYVYNNSQISFTAKKNFSAKKIKISTLKKDLDIVEKNLYTDIKKYKDNVYTKEQYLNNFMTKMNNDVYKHLNKTEQQYVHDIYTTLEMAESYDSISNKYIDDVMNNLLEKKNTKS